MKVNFKIKFGFYVVGLLLLLQANLGFAKTIVISGQKVIDKPTAYRNVTLDLSQGSFLVTNNAILELSNTIVNGTISADNPTWVKMISGKLVFKNNQFKVSAGKLQSDATSPPFYNVIKILQGGVYLVGNSFSVDKTFAVGLLSTDHFATSGFIIRDNQVHNFHGGIFLSNSSQALIADNSFSNVSLSNIFTIHGDNNLYQRNSMLFSGNNGFDVIDSTNITLSENYISLSSCYSILILRSHHVTLDGNHVIGGITYAVYIAPAIGANDGFAKHLLPLLGANAAETDAYKNSRITIINNYFGQNRYGITTTSLDGLVVRNNIFIQKFPDKLHRSFWTNNANLLHNTTQVTWNNNFYKEAFAQGPSENNADALKLVVFPEQGGVVFDP